MTKIHFYEKILLEKMGLNNTESREIKYLEVISVTCHECSIIKTTNFGKLYERFKKKNCGYICNQCSLKNRNTIEAQKKRKETCLKKYGVENPAQTKEIQEKMVKTIQKKYGVDHPSQSKIIKEKQKKANIERYGVEYASQSKEIKEKIKKTTLEKYGVEHPIQSKEIKEKIKQTHLDRYGVEYAQQSKFIQEKAKQTYSERYGVESPLQSEEIQKKFRKTNLERLGVEYPAQSKTVREKCKKTNLKRSGVEHPSQSKIIKEKNKIRNLAKYGVEHYFQSEDYLNKIQEIDRFTSKGEREVKLWIESLGLITYKKRHEGSELDIVVENKRLAIEYNGLYWHSEAKKEANYHLNKTLLAKKNGYRLIHIFEHEWNNRKEQVKGYLKSALGLNTIKIFARKCQIIETDVSDFVDKYHIQGKGRISLGLALVYEGQIVAAATFGKHHRDNKKIVLNRFVSLAEVTVIGGLSRLSKYASNYFKQDIISWADYRLSEGNGYLKAGWEFEKLLKPDYFYIKQEKVFSKQSRKKSNVNTPEGMTEHEHALQDGLLRVYDCGKIRFIYKYKQ